MTISSKHFVFFFLQDAPRPPWPQRLRPPTRQPCRWLSDGQTRLSRLCQPRAADQWERILLWPCCRHLEPGRVSVHYADWTIPVSGHTACRAVRQNPPRHIQPAWLAVTASQVSDWLHAEEVACREAGGVWAADAPVADQSLHATSGHTQDASQLTKNTTA